MNSLEDVLWHLLNISLRTNNVIYNLHDKKDKYKHNINEKTMDLDRLQNLSGLHSLVSPNC